jgi:hypothetical protein
MGHSCKRESCKGGGTCPVSSLGVCLLLFSVGVEEGELWAEGSAAAEATNAI